MIKSSAHEGRHWKPSKTDDELERDALRANLDAFRAVASATGQTVTHLTVVIAVRPTTEGMPS
ncbi:MULTISPECIES: hypothetical protein [Streptomyces]|uniref:hypothetical protein n=1 Tax=Streptomyces TaxID=1883 RepID=UPI0033B0F3CC